MPPVPRAQLPYESRLPAALWPGEKVLWEASPRARNAKHARWLISIWLLIVLGAAAWAVFVAIDHPPRFITGACFVALAAVVIGGAMWMPDRVEPSTSVYRVTDRRVVGVTEDPRREVTSVSFTTLQRMTIEQPARGNSTVSFFGNGAAKFTDVTDSLGVSQLVLGLRRASKRARRRGVKRSQKSEQPMLMPASSQPGQLDQVPPEAALQEGETVLWTGRPRVREPRDGKWLKRRIVTAAWMLVPIALVVARYSEWAQYYVNIHFIVLGLAILWIVASLNALTLTPIREARRRARTRYILTSERAIVLELGGRRQRVQSVFLDSFNRVAFDQRGEDVGDVSTGYGVTFAMVDHASQVHAIVTQAIRAARARVGESRDEADPADELM